MDTSLNLWQTAERLRSVGQASDAEQIYHRLLEDPAWALPARLRLTDLALAGGHVRAACEHALAAYVVREPDPILIEALCQALVSVGELQTAINCLQSSTIADADDVQVLAGLGKLMSDQSLPELALPLLSRARDLGLHSPDLDRLIGLSKMYLGDSANAEAELNRCLRKEPGHAPALRDLAKLRKQTPDNNILGQLRRALRFTSDHHPNAPLLYYALFKSLDDLGQHDAAWQALETGMRLRRRQVPFNPSAEHRLFDQLCAVAGDDRASGEPMDGPVPIFIVGMPRSGTTLLERILGAHSQVTDAGELRDFTCQLRWMCDLAGTRGPHLDPDLVRAADDIDWAELGNRYLRHTQWLARGRAYYTDKMPANFANVGFIAKALPQARILHMVRDPMDVCFSNLKELFGDAYPHSYDQIEMANHYLGYRRLMTHWHQRFPGRILDVHYDSLVIEPSVVVRQVLDHCGLIWEPHVVAIEARSGAVPTASTAQVREPIHRRFVGRWRNYAAQLQPLRERLAIVGAN